MSRPSVAPTATRTAAGTRVPRGRLVVLVMALAAALSGLDAALLRVGVAAPVHSESLADQHGVLMVYGFLGTAIALERAVALQAGARRAAWAYAAPAAGGLGAVLVILQAAGVLPAGRALPGGAWVAAMAVFVAIYLAVWRHQQSYAVLVQLLGALAGLFGAALWARGLEVAAVVPWWAGLLVLTIVGERLELARVAFMAPAVERRILAESSLTVLALAATALSPAWGYPLLGLALGVLMVDVGVHDIAWRTVRARGLTRFMAACMLAGYGWALVSALVWVVGGPALDGYRYDIVVHSLTIGFVMSMILAHAPVIVPALARRPLPYHPVMWAVWGLLHVGLLVRVLSGARAAVGGWQLGGTLSVVALLAFLASTVTLVVRGSGRARVARRADDERAGDHDAAAPDDLATAGTSTGVEVRDDGPELVDERVQLGLLARVIGFPCRAAGYGADIVGRPGGGEPLALVRVGGAGVVARCPVGPAWGGAGRHVSFSPPAGRSSGRGRARAVHPEPRGAAASAGSSPASAARSCCLRSRRRWRATGAGASCRPPIAGCRHTWDRCAGSPRAASPGWR